MSAAYLLTSVKRVLIEGHPALGGENKKFICFRCINCGKEVPVEQGYKMLEEVI